MEQQYKMAKRQITRNEDNEEDKYKDNKEEEEEGDNNDKGGGGGQNWLVGYLIQPFSHRPIRRQKSALAALWLAGYFISAAALQRAAELFSLP